MRISDWSSDVCSSDLHLIQTVTEKKVHYRACNERGDAHYQRQAEAVPHHQAVSRGLIAQHRVYRSRQKWPDCHRRDDSNDQTGEDQYLDRKTHPRGRLRWLAGQIDGRWSEEGLMDEAQRIEHAECARASSDIRKGGIDEGADMLAERSEEK